MKVKAIKSTSPLFEVTNEDPFRTHPRVISAMEFRKLNSGPSKGLVRSAKKITKAKFVGSQDIVRKTYKSGAIFKQTIMGQIPAKSNSYRIVSFGKKKLSTGIVIDQFFRNRLNECQYVDDVRNLMADIEDVNSQRGHYSLAKSSKLKKYEKDFILQAGNVRNLAIDQPFEFEMDVWFQNRRADIDNSLKGTLDVLQPKGVNAIVNDSLCEKVTVMKHIDKLNPRIEFTIKVI